jgi:hypothetical protein
MTAGRLTSPHLRRLQRRSAGEGASDARLASSSGQLPRRSEPDPRSVELEKEVRDGQQERAEAAGSRGRGREQQTGGSDGAKGRRRTGGSGKREEEFQRKLKDTDKWAQVLILAAHESLRCLCCLLSSVACCPFRFMSLVYSYPNSIK